MFEPSNSVLPPLHVELGGEVKNISVDSIFLPEKRQRAIDPKFVKKLADSFEIAGMQQPIGIRSSVKYLDQGCGWELVFGAHRFLAWKSKYELAVQNNDREELARWDLIAAVAYPEKMSDELFDLFEIQENYVRKELTPEERERFAQKRKELLVRFHAKYPRKSVRDIAKETGIPKSTVQRDIGGRSVPRGTPDQKKKAIVDQHKAGLTERQIAAETNTPKTTVHDTIAKQKEPKSKPGQRERVPLDDGVVELCAHVRQIILDTINEIPKERWPELFEELRFEITDLKKIMSKRLSAAVVAHLLGDSEHASDVESA